VGKKCFTQQNLIAIHVHFGKLVAKAYEFVQSRSSVFIRSACLPATV